MKDSGTNLTVCIVTQNDVAVIPATLHSMTNLMINVIIADRDSDDGTGSAGRFDMRSSVPMGVRSVLSYLPDDAFDPSYSVLVAGVEPD